MDPDTQGYFERIEERVEEAYEIASTARAKGYDPSTSVEIPVAKDMADRVQNLLEIPDVAERVRELEAEMSREEAALALAADFAAGRVGEDTDRAGTIEQAVRTSVALLTEGVVAAPIEGIDGVEIDTNDDGTEYVRVEYAGPIRSAGGTAQALSVLVADYTRALLDIAPYKPREQEIERLVEEVALYDDDTGLQYSPDAAETRFIAANCPICLDGEPTSDTEVSGYRDLDRVDTNRARGGLCLVLAEGIALKAPKIKRYTRTLDEVDWPWLDDLMEGLGSDETAERDEEFEAVETPTVGDLPVPAPSGGYLKDLIAGRPVCAHPSRPGGFRLRYGRGRNHGFATAGIHPATMHLLDDFLATGTQIKTELPGKAAGVVPVDTIEGPTVRLRTGEVRRIQDPAEAEEIKHGVERIIDVGEYLVNAGEFVENNYPLAPAGYAVEWWELEMAEAGADVTALHDDVTVELTTPNPVDALQWAETYDAPLHPRYTYLWHDVSAEDVTQLADAVATGKVREGILELGNAVADTLECLLVPFHREGDRLHITTWTPLVRSLGFDIENDEIAGSPTTPTDAAHGLAAVNALAPFEIRAKSPTRIGNRMGRPEKSEKRELSPPVHTLFPLGNAGGDRRDVADATRHADTMQDTPGEITVNLGQLECPSCGLMTFEPYCADCEMRTQRHWECDECGSVVDHDGEERPRCPRCEREVSSVSAQSINLDELYHQALDRVGERETSFPMLKGVKGLMSPEKTPEQMAKGILRAKHDVSAFKDGTVRYDMTDLPVTAVRPDELDVSVEQFWDLGYEEDIHGEPLEHGDQLVELQVQDIVLSTGAAEHLLQTADFVDDLLERFYDLDPFYEVAEREDLIGELVFGLAPHTSAAVVGRIVGFTEAPVGYAHPYFHAAKRRNCFHPETEIWFEDEEGNWRKEAIKAFVEARLDDPERDDFGALVEATEGDVRVQSIDRNGDLVIKPVEAVSKHPAPDHLIRIETRDGRSLTVTPDHEMLRWNGSIERVSASDVCAGDRFPASSGVDATHGTLDSSPLSGDGGHPHLDIVERAKIVHPDVLHTYCLTVAETHTLYANEIATAQCDGDEDCVMLLMDGLLNFSQHYLPENRGGSVAEESRLVAVSPKGDVRFLTFEEFWDELGSPGKQDGKFRKKACFAEGWKTYVFDEEHRASVKPIEKAIRYPADEGERLLEVRTQFGRNLQITPNHSLFRYDDGIEEVAGSELTEGDLVVAPRELDVPTVETTIDVANCTEDPYVVIDDEIETLFGDIWEHSPRGSPTHTEFAYGLSYRLNRDKISFERLDRILETTTTPTVPSNVTVARKAGHTGIDRTINVDENFAWVIGLFVADGTLSGSAPSISNADRALVEEARARIASSLGCEASTRWANRAYEIRLPSVFEDVLYELGFRQERSYNSNEKVIPQCILRGSRDIVVSFIQGFLAGDGTDTADGNVTTLGFYTTSELVKDGIVFLLHRLGLVANISQLTEREGNRQPIYVVTVSGGATDNPLKRILDGQEPYRRKSNVVSIPRELLAIRAMDIEGVKQLIPRYLHRRENISLAKLQEIVDALEQRELPAEARECLAHLQTITDGDLSYLRVKEIEEVEYNGYLYDLQVGGEPIFTANWLYAHNSMDAPLVMSSRIDPAEIDDEAHNMDVVDQYPRSFYEATLERADPSEVDLELAGESVGTAAEYEGFAHTHDTSNIALGPDLSAYKTLETMMEKMDAQLELARKLRAVDETDVAERVIEYHFLPDLIGNLRAFSRQETRCLDCGTKFRRMPLSRSCRRCGGDVNLTVHQGSVSKYMETALRVAEQYGCREYTIQRLELLEREIASVFENDHNKQSGIADFM